MFSYLQSQLVNLVSLQEHACRELVVLLEKIDGSKSIILDDSILGPLGLVASSSLFSDRGIKLLKLNEEMRFPRDINNIIFIVRPKIAIMNTIANLVLKHSKTEKNRLYHIFSIPRRSCICEKQLQDKGVFGNFGQIEELAWNFYPIDSDVVSMELPYAFRDLTVDGDPTVLYQAAIGLVQLQQIFGRIPKIYGKGNHSQRVWEHAKQLGAQNKSLLNGDKGAIDQLIILDRSIDPFSALATQLTYEGLIDEFFGISHNQIALPVEIFTSKSNDGGGSNAQVHTNLVPEKKVIFLNSGDKLYAELRDMNFNAVGKTLQLNIMKISEEMSATGDQNSVQDMKRLVDKLPALLARKQSVEMHTNIAEVIRKRVDEYEFTDDLAAEQDYLMCEDIDKASSYIEDLIGKKSDVRNVLRLMCIQCAAASGFKEKVLNYYKRELVQVYGIELLLAISNLERAGLLYTQSESRLYAVLRKTLNLTVEDVLEVDPKDISYVHSCYAPLSGRIIEQTLKPLGWQSLKSKIGNLPGQTFEDFQAQLVGIGGRQSATPSEGTSLNIPRIVLVFFVGGCTFAEIAALRFLSKQEDNNVQFVIATTKIINKNSFLDCLM